MLSRLRPAARFALAAVAGFLIGCVAIVGPCDLVREPSSWRLSCEQAGTAVVVPPSTLSAIVPPASGAKP
jgi:hypothetical protein